MALSESRKKANAKWDKENMTTLGCKIKRTQAAAFKAYCEGQGKTSNTVLKDYVLECIGEQDTHQDALESSTRHVEAGVVSSSKPEERAPVASEDRTEGVADGD